jgi:hypothetical protein
MVCEELKVDVDFCPDWIYYPFNIPHFYFSVTKNKYSTSETYTDSPSVTLIGETVNRPARRTRQIFSEAA